MAIVNRFYIKTWTFTTSQLTTLQLTIVVIALLAAYTLYKILIYPRWSPYRFLPSPNQGPLWRRIFKEPTSIDFVAWAKEVPNEGLIRYFGVLNSERLHITSAEGVYQLLQRDAYCYVKPTAHRKLLQFLVGENIVVNEGHVHKAIRKGLQPAFTPDRKVFWYLNFSSKASELIDIIKQKLPSEGHPLSGCEGNTINLGRLLSQACLDAIGKDCVDFDFKSMKSPEDPLSRDFIKLFNTSTNAHVLEIMMYIFPSWFLSNLPVTTVKYAQRVTSRVRCVLQEAVQHKSHLQHLYYKGHKDMVEAVVHRDQLNHQQLINNAMTLITAGLEEPSVGLSWAIYFLTQYPEVQNHLRTEIRGILKKSRWKEEGLSENDINSMSYLKAFINEVFRLRPNIPIIWRESTTPVHLLGTALSRPRTVVTASTWAMNRNEHEWGPDTDEFKPERWLNAPTGGVRSPYAFLTFGHGPRKCIGEHVYENDVHEFHGMVNVKIWHGLRVRVQILE